MKLIVFQQLACIGQSLLIAVVLETLIKPSLLAGLGDGKLSGKEVFLVSLFLYLGSSGAVPNCWILVKSLHCFMPMVHSSAAKARAEVAFRALYQPQFGDSVLGIISR